MIYVGSALAVAAGLIVTALGGIRARRAARRLAVLRRHTGAELSQATAGLSARAGRLRDAAPWRSRPNG